MRAPRDGERPAKTGLRHPFRQLIPAAGRFVACDRSTPRLFKKLLALSPPPMNSPAALPVLARRVILLLLCCLYLGAPVRAAAPARLQMNAGEAGVRVTLQIAPVDDAWRAALPRDAKLATQAYLDRLPKEAVVRANDYEEGGYWLQLWEFLLGLAVAALMLHGGRSARVRDWAQRVGRHALLRDGLYGGVYGLAAGLLLLPLNFYRGFWREHSYGMSTQTAADWWGEWVLTLGVEVVGTMVAVALIYAVFRRAGERWWLWGAAACSALLALMLFVSPVLIHPLFNTYRPLEHGPVRSAVLALAQSNGVPADEVYVFDASRQSKRISANVSGLGSTAAVRLNDNLLNRTSLPEIRAVMAHELGHYVLNHAPKMLMQFGLLILFGLLFCQWAMRRLFARYGQGWGTQDVADVAGLPLLAAVFSVFMLAATPVFHSIVRIQEIEADRFGLNLAGDPHGFAEVILKLSDYRKPDPGRLEEVVFFHHPSARHRIHDAMRWREAMGTP
jgi:STE24 endopeptidase